MAEFTLPEKLYHGTRSSVLQDIQRKGLVPRAVSGSSNWSHSVESRADAVYLTTAYALYYAVACEAKGLPALLEIDTSKLNPLLFASDEDGVAQLRDGRAQAGVNATLDEATVYWRDRIHTVHPSTSLGSLGNCTYFGVIPPEAITKVLVLPIREAARLTVQACDPTITVANFRFLGAEYQAFSSWLFDAQAPWSTGHAMVVPPSCPAMVWGPDAVAHALTVASAHPK